MKKPVKKTKEYYDYHECEKYIANKLGIKDLRDCLGKFQGHLHDDTVEYRDFWHYIIEHGGIHNGCYFTMFIEETDEMEDKWLWVKPIIEAFIEEFGDEDDDGVKCEAEFWVEW